MAKFKSIREKLISLTEKAQEKAFQAQVAEEDARAKRASSRAAQDLIKKIKSKAIKRAEEEAIRGGAECTYELEDNGFDMDFLPELLRALRAENLVIDVKPFQTRDMCDNLVTEHHLIIKW